MEPIEVVVRFNENGELTPLNFTWNLQSYQLVSTGRQWVAEDGRHILVMSAAERVFELLFNTLEGRWYLKETGAGQKMA